MEVGEPDTLYSEYLYGRPLYPVPPMAWLAPLWSFVCGVAAAGGWTWTGSSLLRLLLGLLLVGPLLGIAWGAATGNEWREILDDDPPDSMPQTAVPSLPYTLPGSASHRLGTWLSAVVEHWYQVQPCLGKPLLLLTASTVFSLTVASLLGQQCLVITIAGLAAAWVGGFGQRRWTSGPGIAVFVPLFVAWLLGHTAYDSLRPVSVLVAASFASALGACCAIDQGNRGLAWQVTPQVAAVIGLIMVKQPVVAAVVTLLGTLQLLLAPLLETRSGRGQYFRVVQIQLAASMLLAASALGHAS